MCGSCAPAFSAAEQELESELCDARKEGNVARAESAKLQRGMKGAKRKAERASEEAATKVAKKEEQLAKARKRARDAEAKEKQSRKQASRAVSAEKENAALREAVAAERVVHRGERHGDAGQRGRRCRRTCWTRGRLAAASRSRSWGSSSSWPCTRRRR